MPANTPSSDTEQRPPLITLLTDFGTQDGYVGAMKGVIASIAPVASVIDICHSTTPHDLQHAGVVWSAALPYFPADFPADFSGDSRAGCVHVGIVDPGVGTRRRILCFETRRASFLVPDNGLIGYVLSRRDVRRVIQVRNRRYFLPEVSRTFHGRDIFAPVAAHLASGLNPAALGPEVKDFEWSTLPRPRRRTLKSRPRVVEERGEVLYADTFGNLVTNLKPRGDAVFVDLRAAGFATGKLRATYGKVAPGRPLLVVGSAGFLEIAVNRGSAAKQLGLGPGAGVTARFRCP